MLAKRMTELTTAPLYPTWPVTGLTSARTRPTSRAPFTRGPRRTTSVNCSTPPITACKLPPGVLSSEPSKTLTDVFLSHNELALDASASPSRRLDNEASRIPPMLTRLPPSPPPPGTDSLALHLLPESWNLVLHRLPVLGLGENAASAGRSAGRGPEKGCAVAAGRGPELVGPSSCCSRPESDLKLLFRKTGVAVA